MNFNVKLNITSIILISLIVGVVCGATILAFGSTVLFPDTQITEDGLRRAGLLGGLISSLMTLPALGGAYLVGKFERKLTSGLVKTPS